MSPSKQNTRTMDDMAGQAAAGFAEAKAGIMDSGKAALTDIKSSMTDVAATVKDGLEARADVAKDSLADGGHRLAETIRSAAGDQGSGSIQAKVLDLVAGGVSDMSEKLRGRDIRSIATDLQDFARRNPAAFVAGAAVAGFAMARFLRASSPTGTDGGVDFQSTGMMGGLTDLDDGPQTGARVSDAMSGGASGMSSGMGSTGMGGMAGEGMTGSDLSGGIEGDLTDTEALPDDDLFQDGTSTGGMGAGSGGVRP